jgi:hypothetical protein
VCKDVRKERSNEKKMERKGERTTRKCEERETIKRNARKGRWKNKTFN